MTIEDRVAAFEKLGNYLFAIDEVELQALSENAQNENSWFTRESITLAIEGIKHFLTHKNLTQWVSHYYLNPSHSKTIAVVMAGNIPLVGFHDFLSVLISGHSILIKLSSKDTVLLKHLIKKLIEIEPRFTSKINTADQLKNFDAVIATGSDNSARYFHYYFGKYPNVIRKNRTSCAVITGAESESDIRTLGKDVFSFFGLGCRNVSKVYLPKHYDPTLLLRQWEDYKEIINHHKYNNNYDYQKSILLVNGIHHFDNGFVLLQQNERLVSPIAVLYYEFYEDEGALALKLLESKEKIQCIVGRATPDSIPFGKAQSPMLWDYADQIDTLKFLDNLN